MCKDLSSVGMEGLRLGIVETCKDRQGKERRKFSRIRESCKRILRFRRFRVTEDTYDESCKTR